MYDPAIGRFTSVDPLADNSTQLQYSPYAYTWNNPINLIDPDGMEPTDDYFDYISGKYLGSDGASTDNIRLIDPEKFQQISAENGGSTSNGATQQLQAESQEVTLENEKIQNDIQSVHENTLANDVEYSVSIYLDIGLNDQEPKITSTEGPTGNNESTLTEYTAGSEAAYIGPGQVLLGQVHGHPKTNKENTYNVRGTSEVDRIAAQNMGVPIYATKSWTGRSGRPTDIYRVTPSGDHNRQRPGAKQVVLST